MSSPRSRVIPCAAKLFALAVLIFTTGCPPPPGPPELCETPSSNIIFPVSGVSYAQHVQPLFDQTCALSGCHGDGSQSSTLRLTNYDNLMYGGALVIVRNDPGQSILVMRIDGTISEQMPLDKCELTQNQINGFRAWITEGALNN